MLYGSIELHWEIFCRCVCVWRLNEVNICECFLCDARSMGQLMNVQGWPARKTIGSRTTAASAPGGAQAGWRAVTKHIMLEKKSSYLKVGPVDFQSHTTSPQVWCRGQGLQFCERSSATCELAEVLAGVSARRKLQHIETSGQLWHRGLNSSLALMQVMA